MYQWILVPVSSTAVSLDVQASLGDPFHCSGCVSRTVLSYEYTFQWIQLCVCVCMGICVCRL